jgi:transposase
MLNDISSCEKVFIACGYTDLRKGIEGLSTLVKSQYRLDPFQKNVLFLFCGRRSDRIKGLVWEGDGFLLLYKRLEAGAYSWPRNTSEVMSITPEQYHFLMQGFDIVARHPVHEVPGKDII